MTDHRKSVFTWNHISEDLKVEDIKELKSYYQTYHRKCWAYKQAMKRFKKLKLIGDSASIIFASGGIASTAASGGIALIAVSAGALIIQGWMKHQNLDLKIYNCQYAYQSYNHLLIQIKDAMRTGNFEKDGLISSMNNVDCYITDNSPPVDKYLRKYSDKFIESHA